jgi:hypothetical protein
MGRDKRILKKIRPAVTWCDGWPCCAGRRAAANPAQMTVAGLDQTWLRGDRPADVGNQPAAVAGRGRVRYRRFGLAQPGPDRRRSSGRPDPRRGGSRAQLGRRAPADLLARAHRDGLRRGPGPGAGAVGAQLGDEVAGRLPDRGPAHRRGVPAGIAHLEDPAVPDDLALARYPRTAPRCWTGSTCSCWPARPSLWSARTAPARPLWSSCSPACTSRQQARCCWTACRWPISTCPLGASASRRPSRLRPVGAGGRPGGRSGRPAPHRRGSRTG